MAEDPAWAGVNRADTAIVVHLNARPVRDTVMDGTGLSPTPSNWVRPLLIGLLVLYLGGYVAARRAHLLVNYDGHRMWFSVGLFDTSGVVMPHTLPISTALGLGRMSVVLFFPLHRLETLARHGPIHACLSW